MNKAYMNWSGGKDSCMALYKLLQSQAFNIGCLLTSINAAHNRVSMHGVRRSLLETQAVSLGIPLSIVSLPEQPSMADYENIMDEQVSNLKSQGFNAGIFGDIFLEDLRRYREDKLNPAGIAAVFPLWNIDTRQLINEFIAVGFKTIVVCVNEQWLDKSFCGRIIDERFISELPAGVDPCGENGEFHTFVFDGPIFQQPVPFTVGEFVYKEYAAPKIAGGCETKETVSIDRYGFWFCDLY